MRSKIKTVPIAMAILGMLGTFLFVSTSDVYASAIQSHASTPRVIFDAACATCHSSTGLGGVTWIKNDISDKWTAPRIVGNDVLGSGTTGANNMKSKVRNGSSNGRMPAFGPEEITTTELDALVTWLRAQSSVTGAPAASLPPGTAVILNILDADPWYQVGATFTGLPRVALGAGEYLKIYNTGRTWHTFTNPALSKDSGFIGYAGNYKDAVGDLGVDIGYYYADQLTGLATGCNKYLCKIHPYMQVEVCTSTYALKGPTDIGLGGTNGEPAGTTYYAGLTRAHKHPIGLPPVPGVGEVWSPLQSQEEIGEDTTTVANNSVAGFDGAFEVIDATTWAVVKRIADPGFNNPHNAWPGLDSAGNEVVISANWHDNTVTLTDANGAPAAYASLYTRRSGADNAHIMVTPGAAERFYTTHMGGRALQQIDADALRLGGNPNVIAGHIRGATGPHGIWMCDDGVHVLTADTFGQSATLFNTAMKLRKTASSGGKAPLAPAIMSGFQGGCRRGFTNNALTADVSVYEMHTPVTPLSGGISHLTSWPDNPAGHLYKNAAGNIALRNVCPGVDCNNPLGEAPASLVFMARWANLPIQTPVSASDSGNRHGQYMVTANKASFNVQVTKLDPTTGLPIAFYTFPAGLGAHGVNFGKKSVCTNGTTGNCYYAYVPNTFEDYLSVYDLEKIEVPCGSGGMCAPGSALLSESAYVEGGAVTAVAALDPRVAGLCDVVDDVAGVLRYDLPPSLCVALGLPALNCSADPGGDGEAGSADYNLILTDASADVLHCGVGAMDTISVGAIASGAVLDGTPVLPLAPGQSLYVADVPIGVLCPDCRSGVHVGDVPLNLTSGAPLAGPPTVILGITLATDPTGATSKYTYVKDEVYVDTENVACALDTVNTLGGALNDCNSATLGDAAGTINGLVSMDLSLGINTGGQGIMPRDPVAGSAPTLPWP